MSTALPKKAAAKSFKGPDACVRCKGQKQGAPKCRGERNHTVEEHPATSLSQSVCVTLMGFRTTTYPQPDLLVDQQLLEQALQAGGAGSVAAAMAKLKGETLPEQDSFDVDAALAEDGWEYSLTAWPEPLKGAQTYELRTKLIEADNAMTMLRGDDFFNTCILCADISPTHLTTTDSAVSIEQGAVNYQAALCPHIVKWLTGSRKGEWVFAGLGDNTCKLQHHYEGGREGDELLHPEEELRWVIFVTKTQQWALP